MDNSCDLILSGLITSTTQFKIIYLLLESIPELLLVQALMNNKYSFHVVLICNTLESNTLDEGIHTVLIHVGIQMLPLFIPLLEHMLRSIEVLIDVVIY